MTDVTTFEQLSEILTEEIEADILENFGEPTTEQLGEIYAALVEARSGFGGKPSRGLPAWSKVTGKARAGARGKTSQQLRMFQRKRRVAIRTRSFRRMSPKQRRHLRQLQRTVAKTARVRRKAVRSLGRTRKRAGAFMQRMRGRVGKFMGRRTQKKAGKKVSMVQKKKRMAADVEYDDTGIAEEFVTAALEQELTPEQLAELFTETSFEKLDDNMYLFAVELTHRLLNNDTTKDKFFDWEIDEESDVWLYFENAKDKDVIKKIQEMLEKIGETETVIVEGDEIDKNLHAQFTVFSFFPNKEAFVSLREDFNNEVEGDVYIYINSVVEKLRDGEITKEAEWSPPEELLATGSADTIASALKSESSGLKQAMGRLNTYINLCGAKTERKRELNAAKAKLRGLYKAAS